MPRTLALIAIVLSSLAGCAHQPPHAKQAQPEVELESCTDFGTWLNLQRQVDAMSDDQVLAELAKQGQPAGPDELFYFGLLHHSLDDYGSWTLARDVFREVGGAPGLLQQQVQLAGVLQQFNQVRINWYQKYRQLEEENLSLQSELEQSEADRMTLQKKIRAITELETSISTRKEQ